MSAPFDAWIDAPPDLDAFHGLNDWDLRLDRAQLRLLAGFGLLAPSNRNTTPQRFRLDADAGAIAVHLDRRFVQPHDDPHGRQAAIGLGCAIHNIERAARCYGLEPRVEVTGDTAWCRPAAAGGPPLPEMAVIRLAPRDHADDPTWLKAMIERRTVRALYHMERLARSTIAGMRGHLRRHHPHLELTVVVDGAAKKALGRQQEVAMSRRLNADGFAAELGRQLLPNDDDRSVRGMRGYEWGLDAAQAMKMRLGLMGEGALTPQEKAAFSLDEREMMVNSAAVCILSAPADSLEHRLSAGRAFEDIALHQWRDGFVSCIHSALVELPEGAAKLAAAHVPVGVPLLVLRSGRLRYPEHGRRPRAARPPLDDILLDDSDGEAAR